ncbi:uncharacterized protein LOC144818148 [Lissotriton helveticus]
MPRTPLRVTEATVYIAPGVCVPWTLKYGSCQRKKAWRQSYKWVEFLLHAPLCCLVPRCRVFSGFTSLMPKSWVSDEWTVTATGKSWLQVFEDMADRFLTTNWKTLDHTGRCGCLCGHTPLTTCHLRKRGSSLCIRNSIYTFGKWQRATMTWHKWKSITVSTKKVARNMLSCLPHQSLTLQVSNRVAHIHNHQQFQVHPPRLNVLHHL